VSVLDKVRRWIDGETAELVLEEAARDAQVKPRSQAEEFIVKIARAVETVMQREMVPLPQGTTIIPSEYTIFLSDQDDKEWQGVKRRGLQQGLYHILAERAKEIAGRKKLETRSFVIELRVDGTLEPGDIRVQHSWEDSTTNKTGVLARPAALDQQKAQPQPPQKPRSQDPGQAEPTVRYTPPKKTQESADIPRDAAYRPPVSAPATVIQNVVPPASQDGEVLTNVRRRPSELFKLEIWLNNVRQNVVPIYKYETTIGRGSRSKPVDIPLVGDPEISRRHLVLSTDGKGQYWIVNEGRNAAMIANREIPSNQKIAVTPGMAVAICTYVIRIQP
jgi:hypothetical protein